VYFNLSNHRVIDLIQVLLRYLNYNEYAFIENALCFHCKVCFEHLLVIPMGLLNLICYVVSIFIYAKPSYF